MNAQVEATAKQLLGFCADNAEAKLDTVSPWEIKGIGKSYCLTALAYVINLINDKKDKFKIFQKKSALTLKSTFFEWVYSRERSFEGFLKGSRSTRTLMLNWDLFLYIFVQAIC